MWNRKQIGEKKFGKTGFHTLRRTMFHRTVPYYVSLKIAAAYWTSSVSGLRNGAWSLM